MAVALHNQESVFSANRAVGRVELSVAAENGHTRRRHVYEDGSLRVRFPHSGGEPLETVFINTAGGMAGGDRFAIDLAVGDGAHLLAGTAAAEKVYRSAGPDTAVSVNISVAEGGQLAWLPQETILFDHARLTRRFDIDLAPGASLIMAEAIVFGRSAMDEVVKRGRLNDRWRVRQGGRLMFAETIRLDGDIAVTLAEPAVAAGGVAIASVLSVPGDERMVAAVRALPNLHGEVGISAWNGIAVVRLCARDGAALRHDLSAVLAALSAPLPRLWLN